MLLTVAVGVAVQALPALAFPHVLSQDGPAHLDGAWVLVHHDDPGAMGAALRLHYRTDLSPVPNMLSTLLLAALLRVLSPDAAERTMVVFLIGALAGTLAWAARAVDRRAGWLAVAALPFAGSYLMAFGFYNFAWGMAGFLAIAGLALGRRCGWSTRSTMALAALLTVTWSAHLLPWVAACGLVGLLALSRAAAARSAGVPIRISLRRQLLPPVLAALPSLALTAIYLQAAHAPPMTPDGLPTPGRIAALLSGVKPFVVARPAELLAAAAVVLVLLLLGVASAGTPGRRVPAERRALLVLLTIAVGAVCLTPKRLGPAFGFLDDRLAWFPPLILALVVATRLPARRAQMAAAAVLLVASSAAVLVRLPAQRPAAQATGELLAMAPHMRAGSTLLVLAYARTGILPGFVTSPVPDTVRHEASRLALRVGAVDIGHYEAAQPYFQVKFAGPQLNRRLASTPGALELVPPRVDLAAVRGQLDYVLLVGLDQASPATLRSPWTGQVFGELTGHYHRVATSQTGIVQLWSADGGPPPATVEAP